MSIRGIRNHNPGNIEKGAPWQGLDPNGKDPRFCVFVHPKWGIRAIARVLITYCDKRRAKDGSNIDTVREIIERWAPSHENPTNQYAQYVARQLERGVDDLIDITEYSVMRALVVAIIEFENGKNPYPDAVIDEGLKLAGIEVPVKPRKPLHKSRTIAGAVLGGTGIVMDDIIKSLEQTSVQIEQLQSASWVDMVSLGFALFGFAMVAYARVDDWLEERK